MKLSELSKVSGVSKDTIHFYIREGLLPKPKKRNRNQAVYDESFVERIRLIKELQDKLFLPLSEIKKIVTRHKSTESFSESLEQLKSEYFRPIKQMTPEAIEGEEAFREATGLGAKWLAKSEEWLIITPEIRNGVKHYSQDDITLGKLIVDMDRIGLGPKEGFAPEKLKDLCELLRFFAVTAQKVYIKATFGRLAPEEFSKRAIEQREIMSLFTYHLNRKLYREEYKRLLNLADEREDNE